MSEHARLSPSSSKGWLACAGRIALEAPYPSTSSTAADEGTAMHLIAKLVLTEPKVWPNASTSIGKKVPVHSPGELTRVIVFTEEMAELTQGYIDTMTALGALAEVVRTEHRVDFSSFVNVPDQFGTADRIHLVKLIEEPGYELGVYDLKTGWIRVSPVNNTQGMLYALGAYREFEMSHDIRRIRIGIYQPKHDGLSEWVLPVGVL